MTTKLGLTPTIREVNGKKLSFYSPQQLAIIIKPEIRLPKQSLSTNFEDIVERGSKKLPQFTHAT